MASNIAKKLDVNDCSFIQLTLILSLHYLEKCRSRSLAINNNEFILDTCVRSEMINSIETIISISICQKVIRATLLLLLLVPLETQQLHHLHIPDRNKNL